MDLVLIRHPAVAVEPGLCYGDTDVPLASDADASAARLVERLAALGAPPPDAMWTSPSMRCARVAAGLSARLNVAPIADARLKEMYFGAWERQRWDAIERAQLDAWAADFDHARPHGGESVAQFAARVRGWFDGFNADADAHAAAGAANVAYVIAHAGTLRVIAGLALGVPVVRSLRWPLELGGAAWLRIANGQWALVKWNV